LYFQPLEHLADLRPAAMHDDGVDAHLLEQHDVLGELARERGVAHGVAAVFDDEGLAGELAHIGQGLRQRRRRLEPGIGGFKLACFHSSLFSPPWKGEGIIWQKPPILPATSQCPVYPKRSWR